MKPGEHSTLVTFWHIGEEKTVRQADGRERKQAPFLLRYYRVFNVCQTEGIADKLGLGNTAQRVPSIELCEVIADGMPNRPTVEQSDPRGSAKTGQRRSPENRPTMNPGH